MSGEREELARFFESEAPAYERGADYESLELAEKLRRAALLLRQPPTAGRPTPPRIPYDRRTTGDGSAYDRSRCSYCCRPLKPSSRADALTLTRTNNGDWHVVPPGAPVREDERQLGDPHFWLPIGGDCLKQHPEFLIGLVRDPTAPPSGVDREAADRALCLVRGRFDYRRRGEDPNLRLERFFQECREAIRALPEAKP